MTLTCSVSSERNKASNQTSVLWCESIYWKSDPLKHWPLTLYSFGFWCIISVQVMKGRWTDANWQSPALGAVCRMGSSLSHEVPVLLLGRAYDKKLVSFINGLWEGLGSWPLGIYKNRVWEFLWDLEHHSLLAVYMHGCSVGLMCEGWAELGELVTAP
jgi:hypothetical protein